MSETPVSPAILLKDFLEKNHLKIGLSPLKMRQLEDGSLLLDQSTLLITKDETPQEQSPITVKG